MEVANAAFGRSEIAQKTEKKVAGRASGRPPDEISGKKKLKNSWCGLAQKII